MADSRTLEDLGEVKSLQIAVGGNALTLGFQYATSQFTQIARDAFVAAIGLASTDRDLYSQKN
jgi:hypothetical protein